MPRTVTVTLDGKDYEVPRLNIGQLEEVTEAFATKRPAAAAYAVLGIAMKRASPPLDGFFDDIEPTVEEIRIATEAVLAHSGFAKNAEAPADAPGQNPAAS